MNRTLGIVLMGLRKPEIDQRPIAHIPCDKALKPSHKTGYALLIAGDDISKIFRIKPSSQQRRSDEIDKHDRKLPALGGGVTMPGDPGGRLFCKHARKSCATISTESFAGRIFAAASLACQR